MNKLTLLFLYFAAVASIIVTLFFLFKYIKTKILNINSGLNYSELESILLKLDELIETNVISINQTFVNELKEQKSFSQLDKEEAFEMCREMVDKSISEKDRAFIRTSMGDIDEWLNNRIEYYVRLNKNTQA